jgi:hypothetical protein
MTVIIARWYTEIKEKKASMQQILFSKKGLMHVLDAKLIVLRLCYGQRVFGMIS